MIARWPAKIAAGATTDHISAFQDVLPTVLELTGAAYAGPTDGISFAPTLLGEEEQPKHDYLYWEHGGKQAVLIEDWKAVRRGLKKNDLSIEIYRLEGDPQERKDLSAELPELVDQLVGKRLATVEIGSPWRDLAIAELPGEGADLLLFL